MWSSPLRWLLLAASLAWCSYRPFFGRSLAMSTAALLGVGALTSTRGARDEAR